MKTIGLILTIASFVTFGIGQAKNATKQISAPKIVLDTEFSVNDMEAVLAKAKWQDVSKDERESVFSIDTNVMIRIKEVVFFRERHVKRGTSFYSTYAGDCSEDMLRKYNRFVVYPGKPKLVKLEVESVSYPVTEGTIGGDLLNYVCENASVHQ